MLDKMAQPHSEFHGITPLQAAASLSQQSNFIGSHSATTTITPDLNTTMTATVPSFADSKECDSSDLQFEVVEVKAPLISHSLLPHGLQNITTHNSNTAVYQNVSLPVESSSSVATGSFLFGSSEESFSKDHGQLLCAPDEIGTTIPLPVRQSGFSDTNPLTPARNKICSSDYTDQGTPLTPTANLKLLLSAASPAIREREMMQQNAKNVCRSILTDNVVTEEFEYSRKQKSLSILCSRCVCVRMCVRLQSIYLCKQS